MRTWNSSLAGPCVALPVERVLHRGMPPSSSVRLTGCWQAVDTHWTNRYTQPGLKSEIYAKPTSCPCCKPSKGTAPQPAPTGTHHFLPSQLPHPALALVPGSLRILQQQHGNTCGSTRLEQPARADRAPTTPQNPAAPTPAGNPSPPLRRPGAQGSPRGMPCFPRGGPSGDGAPLSVQGQRAEGCYPRGAAGGAGASRPATGPIDLWCGGRLAWAASAAALMRKTRSSRPGQSSLSARVAPYCRARPANLHTRAGARDWQEAGPARGSALGRAARRAAAAAAAAAGR